MYGNREDRERLNREVEIERRGRGAQQRRLQRGSEDVDMEN